MFGPAPDVLITRSITDPLPGFGDSGTRSFRPYAESVHVVFEHSQQGGGTRVRRFTGFGLIAIVAFAASVPTPRPVGAIELRHATAAPRAGYWLSGGDGGVFAFGSAPFYGSGATVPGACSYHQLPGEIQTGAVCDGIAPTPSGNGYWLLNSVGFPVGFGHASEYGQAGCTASVPGVSSFPLMWSGMTSSATGYGFLVARSDGAVSGCGDGIPAGALISVRLAAPIVGIASTPDGRGYSARRSRRWGVLFWGCIVLRFRRGDEAQRSRCRYRFHPGWQGLLVGRFGWWSLQLWRCSIRRFNGRVRSQQAGCRDCGQP